MTGRRWICRASRKQTHASASASGEGFVGSGVRRYPNREGAINWNPYATSPRAENTPWSHPPLVPCRTSTGKPSPSLAYSNGPHLVSRIWLPDKTRALAIRKSLRYVEYVTPARTNPSNSADPITHGMMANAATRLPHRCHARRQEQSKVRLRALAGGAEISAEIERLSARR
jgi:hypothetical protein